MKKQIIIVDDEQDFLDSMRRCMRMANYSNVMLENDPLKVAAFFKNGGTADIVVIDLVMPGMGGLELMELIRAASPETIFIIMTGSEEETDRIKADQHGALGYLKKPVTSEKFMRTIDMALKIARKSGSQ